MIQVTDVPEPRTVAAQFRSLSLPQLTDPEQVTLARGIEEGNAARALPVLRDQIQFLMETGRYVKAEMALTVAESLTRLVHEQRDAVFALTVATDDLRAATAEFGGDAA